MKFKHLILLGGDTWRRRRRSGEAAGLASPSLSLLSALSLPPLLFLVFALARKRIIVTRLLSFLLFSLFLLLFFSFSNLSSPSLQVVPAGNSLLNVLTLGFFTLLHFSLISFVPVSICRCEECRKSSLWY